jgi:CheY-like chemotaxis protein
MSMHLAHSETEVWCLRDNGQGTKGLTYEYFFTMPPLACLLPGPRIDMTAPPSHREGWRIIVTDNKPAMVCTLTETLRAAGQCVFAAYDGEAALELFIQLPRIDLLITNTYLGTVHGPELVRRVREIRPDMPILHVMQTGDPDGDMPPDVPTLRAPFTPNQLLLKMGSLLA